VVLYAPRGCEAQSASGPSRMEKQASGAEAIHLQLSSRRQQRHDPSFLRGPNEMVKWKA
jgi:hypothetical protein